MPSTSSKTCLPLLCTYAHTGRTLQIMSGDVRETEIVKIVRHKSVNCLDKSRGPLAHNSIILKYQKSLCGSRQTSGFRHACVMSAMTPLFTLLWSQRAEKFGTHLIAQPKSQARYYGTHLACLNLLDVVAHYPRQQCVILSGSPSSLYD